MGAAPDDSASGRFGSGTLKVDGKIYAGLSRGRLLLKLPQARVDALVAAKSGERFSTGAGRPKRQWVTVAADSDEDWAALAREARSFVASST